MKPIMMSGHTRPLTQVKFNVEGDLLFSTSKDKTPMVWFAHNGERLGTFEGHNGTVWCCDVRYDSSLLITGSADNSCRLWDVQTGRCLATIDTKSAVRACGWAYSGTRFFIATDKAMGQNATVFVFDLAAVTRQGGDAEPLLTIVSTESKITSAVWGLLDETIVTGHENGALTQWDALTGAVRRRIQEHSGPVVDLQVAADLQTFVSASKDMYAKIWDLETLKVVKTFKTDRPVNSAAMSSLKPHVIMGGGQEASQVTTSSSKVGKFDARLYHVVFEEEIGRVKGHFGPINTVAFTPDGKGYVSGGEDGYLRLHRFDDSYFAFDFEH